MITSSSTGLKNSVTLDGVSTNLASNSVLSKFIVTGSIPVTDTTFKLRQGDLVFCCISGTYGWHVVTASSIGPGFG